jgi:hypothetical protein
MQDIILRQSKLKGSNGEFLPFSSHRLTNFSVQYTNVKVKGLLHYSKRNKLKAVAGMFL